MPMRLRAAITLLGLLFPCLLMGQQLFSDGAGWYRQPGYASTAAQRHLYWSTDWGAHWDDITPEVPDGYQLGNILFLDRTRGWVFLIPLCGARGGSPNRDLHAGLKLAFTADSGKSWQMWDVRLPKYSEPFSVGDGPYSLSFADAEHGWMRLGLVSNAYLGVLLATKDSGRTWRLLPKSPSDLGSVSFTTAKDGWMTQSGPLRIWRTEDGGLHWRDVSPSVPRSFGLAFGNYPTVLQGRKRVFVPVLFMPASGDRVVLYLTEDQGRTWKTYITLPSRQRNGPPLSVVGSSMITAELSSVTKETPKQILTLTTVTTAGASKTQQSEAPSLPPQPPTSLSACPTELYGLNMADENHGWTYVSCGITDMLFATVDAGKSWSNVSPAPVPEMTDYRLGNVDNWPCKK